MIKRKFKYFYFLAHHINNDKKENILLTDTAKQKQRQTQSSTHVWINNKEKYPDHGIHLWTHLSIVWCEHYIVGICIEQHISKKRTIGNCVGSQYKTSTYRHMLYVTLVLLFTFHGKFEFNFFPCGEKQMKFRCISTGIVEHYGIVKGHST